MFDASPLLKQWKVRYRASFIGEKANLHPVIEFEKSSKPRQCVQLRQLGIVHQRQVEGLKIQTSSVWLRKKV